MTSDPERGVNKPLENVSVFSFFRGAPNFDILKSIFSDELILSKLINKTGSREIRGHCRIENLDSAMAILVLFD